MEQLLVYVPIALDVVAVVFLLMCLKQGYKEGLSRCMRAAGEFLALIISILIAIEVSPHCTGITNGMIKVGGVIGVDSGMVTTVMKYAIPIILFVIFFTVLLMLWKFVADKTDKLASKKGAKGLDRVGGIVMELIIGVVVIAIVGWMLYDLTGIVSTEIIENTTVVSFILRIL